MGDNQKITWVEVAFITIVPLALLIVLFEIVGGPELLLGLIG